MSKAPFDASDIAAAELLMGVEYTTAERGQMLKNLEGQIASARARRGVKLANSVPVASRFDPWLAGFKMRSHGIASRFSTADRSPLPRDHADIAFAPVTQLSAWIERVKRGYGLGHGRGAVRSMEP